MKLFFTLGFVGLLAVTMYLHWKEDPDWLLYAILTILYRFELIRGEQE